MRQSHIMPGFRPTLGITLFYLGLVVLIPLSTLVFKSLTLSWDEYVHIITNKRVAASFRVSFSTSLIAAAIASFFGFIIAWTFVRYRFAGKRILDALIDLPFALPTAVAGIILATIYQPSGYLGRAADGHFRYKSGVQHYRHCRCIDLYQLAIRGAYRAAGIARV